MKLLTMFMTLSMAASVWANEETQSSRWYIHIDFPARFKVDPLSHTGERKWWAKYDDPDSGLSISTNSYGYISDLDFLLTVPELNHDNFLKKIDADGRPAQEIIAADAKHKTVKSFFLHEILPLNSESTEFPYYVRYIARADSSVKVFYFNKALSEATFGQCYETLSFHFPRGSYRKHEKVISEVISSARPWLSRIESDSGRNRD